MEKTAKKRKAQIKYWLEVHDMSRQELASRLGVTTDSVNSWLSAKTLPTERWTEIQEIFEHLSEPVHAGEHIRVVGSVFTKHEIKRLEAAAAGQPLDLFFRECVLSLINKPA